MSVVFARRRATMSDKKAVEARTGEEVATSMQMATFAFKCLVIPRATVKAIMFPNTASLWSRFLAAIFCLVKKFITKMDEKTITGQRIWNFG